MPSGCSCIYHTYADILLGVVFPRENSRVFLPVTRIAVHCDVALARVGQQEHNRDFLFYGCRGGTNDIEVVEEPRKRRMIFACPRLKRLVWLYYPNQKTTCG